MLADCTDCRGPGCYNQSSSTHPMIACKLFLAGSLLFSTPEEIPDLQGRAAAHLQEGLRLLKENQLEQAKQELLKVLESGQTTPGFFVLLASVLEKNGERERALEILEQGRARYPNSAQIVAEIGTIYLEMQDYEVSIPLLRRAVELQPEEADYGYNLGVAYHRSGVQAYGRGQYFDGLFLAKQALELDPQVAYFHHLQGICYLALEQHNDAEQALRRALELEKDRPGFLYDLALLYVARRDFRKAEPLLARVINLQPDFAHGYYFLGLSYRNIGQAEQAIETFRKALQSDPSLKEKEVHYQLGYCYRLLGKFQLAIQEMETEVSLKPGSLAARLELADLYLGERNYDKALEYAAQSAVLDPSEARAHLLLGRALLGMNRHQEALDAFARTTQLDPERAEAYYLASRAHLKMGRRDLAEKQIELYQRLKASAAAAETSP